MVPLEVQVAGVAAVTWLSCQGGRLNARFSIVEHSLFHYVPMPYTYKMAKLQGIVYALVLNSCS